MSRLKLNRLHAGIVLLGYKSIGVTRFEVGVACRIIELGKAIAIIGVWAMTEKTRATYKTTDPKGVGRSFAMDDEQRR